MHVTKSAIQREDTAGLFSPRRLGHANMFVSDYMTAAHYYRDVFGFEEVYRQPDNLASFISNGNTYHDFALVDVKSRYAREGQKPGLNHMAFEVRTEADLVEGYDRAVAAGVQFLMTADHDVARSLYLKDPDGNEVEIYADVVADWRSARSGIIIKKKPQWVPGVTNVPGTEPLHPVDPPIRRTAHAMVHSRCVTHVAMVARDYEAMYDFYTGVVGLKPLFGGYSEAFALLGGCLGLGDFALYRANGNGPTGLHHIGVMVQEESDLASAAASIESTGASIVADLQTPVRHVVFVRDPDGIPIQLYIDKDWRPEAIAGFKAEQIPYLV